MQLKRKADYGRKFFMNSIKEPVVNYNLDTRQYLYEDPEEKV